jgi:hypothetical protein
MISSRSHGVPGSPDRYSALRRLTGRVGRRFHVMAKPAGSACNLECGYCFYLSKQNLPGGPGGGHMDDDLLDRFVRDYIQSVTADEVVFSAGLQPQVRVPARLLGRVSEEPRLARAGWRAWPELSLLRAQAVLCACSAGSGADRRATARTSHRGS